MINMILVEENILNHISVSYEYNFDLFNIMRNKHKLTYSLAFFPWLLPIPL